MEFLQILEFGFYKFFPRKKYLQYKDFYKIFTKIKIVAYYMEKMGKIKFCGVLKNFCKKFGKIKRKILK